MQSNDPRVANMKQEPGNSATGYVRRINMEPIGTGRNHKLVCSVFLVTSNAAETQLYTDDPRLEAALFAAYLSVFQLEKKPSNVEMSFVSVEIPGSGGAKEFILERVDLVEMPPAI